MKKYIITYFLLFFCCSLFAENAPNLASIILGKWKIVKVENSDQPAVSAVNEAIGVLELKPDGSYKQWIQYQRHEPTPIGIFKGTWELKESQLTMIPEGASSKDIASVRFDTDLLAISLRGGDSSATYYFKKMIENLPDNTFEGVKKEFVITFPENWKTYTPANYSLLGSEISATFIKDRLSVLAMSPDQDGIIILNISPRKVSEDVFKQEIQGSIESAGVRSDVINERQWRIETLVTENPVTRGCHASTYFDGGTIRVVFTFLPSFTSNANEFVTSVLSTFKPM